MQKTYWGTNYRGPKGEGEEGRRKSLGKQREKEGGLGGGALDGRTVLSISAPRVPATGALC
jgi:hypothetical protein